MFGLFKKKAKAERRYDVTRIQFELVVISSRLVKKQTDMFKTMKGEREISVDPPLLSAGYITPWVIGYCTGLLDAVTQTEANRMVFTSEMLGIFFAAVFGDDDKAQEAMVMYIACNESSPSDHGFHVIYELYMSGLAKAFSEVCEDKPIIGLLNYLMQD